jgi:tetratricopeptide (TPR) repeat protein
MRPSHSAVSVVAFTLMVSAPLAWSAGGGQMSAPSGGGFGGFGTQMSPQLQAKVNFNSAVKQVEKADKLQESAATLTDEKKKARALKDAKSGYTTALGKLAQVLKVDSHMPEAWNYLGYTSRKLGNYEDALKAYSNALLLRPGYPQAIEYRGEAFLGVNRISDAQQSYLDLFAGNRALADKLLAAMKSWIAAQRSASAAGDATAVEDLDKWVQERAQIAAQTASLTRTGTSASWP